MNRIFLGIFIFFIMFCLAGCKTTGYTVTVATDKIDYSQISGIRKVLESENFKIGFKEKEMLDSRVQTCFDKKLHEEAYWFIDACIRYAKDDEKKIAQQFEIVFSNIYIGLITPEIKSQIDDLGNEFRDYLGKIVGKENVTIESREWGPPRFY